MAGVEVEVGVEVRRPAEKSTRVVMGDGQEPGSSVDRLALWGKPGYRQLENREYVAGGCLGE